MRKLFYIISLCIIANQGLSAESISSEGRLGIGISCNTTGTFYGPGNEFVPYFTYVNHCYTFGLGVNIDNFDSNNKSSNFIGHAGLRHKIADCSYLTYGVSGNYVLFWNDTQFHKYMVGPFIGIDHHLSNNLMLIAQIMPYNYNFQGVNRYKLTSNQSFKNGRIALVYLF